MLLIQCSWGISIFIMASNLSNITNDSDGGGSVNKDLNYWLDHQSRTDTTPIPGGTDSNGNDTSPEGTDPSVIIASLQDELNATKKALEDALRKISGSSNLAFSWEDLPTTMEGLNAWLNQMGTQLNDFDSYAQAFKAVYDLIDNKKYASLWEDAWGNQSSELKASLVEKLTNKVWDFWTNQYNNAYNLQSWYLQQQYNSPSAQVDRYSSAGLNSAFTIGSYSNTADSSPGSSGSSVGSSGGSDSFSRAAQAYENRQAEFRSQDLTYQSSQQQLAIESFKAHSESDLNRSQMALNAVTSQNILSLTGPQVDMLMSQVEGQNIVNQGAKLDNISKGYQMLIDHAAAVRSTADAISTRTSLQSMVFNMYQMLASIASGMASTSGSSSLSGSSDTPLLSASENDMFHGKQETSSIGSSGLGFDGSPLGSVAVGLGVASRPSATPSSISTNTPVSNEFLNDLRKGMSFGSGRTMLATPGLSFIGKALPWLLGGLGIASTIKKPSSTSGSMVNYGHHDVFGTSNSYQIQKLKSWSKESSSMVKEFPQWFQPYAERFHAAIDGMPSMNVGDSVYSAKQCREMNDIVGSLFDAIYDGCSRDLKSVLQEYNTLLFNNN